MTSKICRVCFDEGDDFNSLGVGNGSNGHKLSCCVPEIDVYIVGDPAICKPCLSMVKVAYALRETCIENEKKFNGKFKSACVVTKSEDALPQIDGCETDFIVYNDYFNEIGNATAQETNETSERNVDEKEYLCPKCRRSFRSPNGVNAHYRYCRKKNNKTIKKKAEDKSEEELVKSVNEMCAALDDFDEKPSITSKTQGDVGVSFELFSDDDDGSFELNLDMLNLFDANDEVPPSDRSALFRCKICGVSFVSGKFLDAHLKTHDPNDERRKSCGICNKSFDNFSSILLHLLEHTGEDGLYCRDCNVKFKTKALKLGHRCTRFACGICGQVYFSKRDVHTHNKSHHSEISSPPCKEYQCKLCLTVCYSRSSYEKHLKRHETATKLEETCQVCGDKSETALLLKQHIIEKHCTKEVRVSLIDFRKDESDLNVAARETVVLICYACKELYMNVELYLRHMRMMHNTCAICKQKLYDINTIIKHVNEHYRYQNNEKRKRKIQNELLVNTIKICCEQCNIEFYDDDTFKRHLREFHDYNNKCNVCTKQFPNTKELYEHMLIHVTKLYTCTRCSSVFQTKLEHKVHMKEHNICKACDKTFVHSVNLRRHMSFYHSSTTRSSRTVENKKRKTKKVTAPSQKVGKRKQVYERCTIENGTKNKDHEEQNNVVSDPRVIQCEMCKQRFDTQLKLRAHVQVHI